MTDAGTTMQRSRMSLWLVLCALSAVLCGDARGASTSASFVLQPSVSAGGETSSSTNHLLTACIEPVVGGLAVGATQSLTTGCGALMVSAPGVVAPPSADLAVVKTTSTLIVLVGGTISYTITVTNNGPDGATGVTVTDALPANTTLQSATASQGTCAGTTTVICSLGALANGATATVSLDLTATGSGNVVNTASVSGAESDPAGANNSAPAPAVVVAPAVAAEPVPLSPAALLILAALLAAIALHRH